MPAVINCVRHAGLFLEDWNEAVEHALRSACDDQRRAGDIAVISTPESGHERGGSESRPDDGLATHLTSFRWGIAGEFPAKHSPFAALAPPYRWVSEARTAPRREGRPGAASEGMRSLRKPAPAAEISSARRAVAGGGVERTLSASMMRCSSSAPPSATMTHRALRGCVGARGVVVEIDEADRQDAGGADMTPCGLSSTTRIGRRRQNSRTEQEQVGRCLGWATMALNTWPAKRRHRRRPGWRQPVERAAGGDVTSQSMHRSPRGPPFLQPEPKRWPDQTRTACRRLDAQLLPAEPARPFGKAGEVDARLTGGNRHAEFVQRLGESRTRDRLAVDEHAVAIEDNELDGSGLEPGSIARLLLERGARGNGISHEPAPSARQPDRAGRW